MSDVVQKLDVKFYVVLKRMLLKPSTCLAESSPRIEHHWDEPGCGASRGLLVIRGLETREQGGSTGSVKSGTAVPCLYAYYKRSIILIRATVDGESAKWNTCSRIDLTCCEWMKPGTLAPRL